jgi:uncharacterized protein (TIGR00255 family)
MIRSMTGFGQGSAESDGYRVTVDVRTVNHRFVDVRVRVPSELAALERDARKRILARVRRGRVEASFRVDRIADAASRVRVNAELVRSAVHAAHELAAEHGLPGALTVSDVLRVPGVLVEDRSADPEVDGLAAAAVGALDRALDSLQADREREGEDLRRDLAGRIESMRGWTASVREHAAEVPRRAREKLLERLAALSQGVELDPARLAQEATFLADRADVTEELVRLDAHLDEALRILGTGEQAADEPVGKRMDFLVQEIHRETNTINSKSSELEISRAAMALKTETEKVREQVQNLE